MQRYLLIRAGQGLVALFVVSVLVFLIARLTGNPLDVMLPMEATKEDYARMEQLLGLDKPLPVQYVYFVRQAVKGDLGTSIRVKRPVSELIQQRLPNSARLAVVAMAFSLFFAFGLGVSAAVGRGSWVDGLARVLGALGMATPAFLLGLGLILIFGFAWGVFPISGIGGPSHYIMPGFTLGWVVSSGMMRLVRSSMVESLDQEYIKLARIKGVPERWVIWRHALRNALLPVVTFAGYYFALMVGSAVVVETVFAWPGMGRLAYQAVMWRDYPLIQGVVLTIATITVMMNLLVDILYAYVDPRIRY